MTREEAIRQIENRWSIMDYGESEALGEALDMAIESLQSDAVPIQEVKLKDGFKIDDIDENYEPKIVGNAKFVRSKCEVTDLISRADAIEAVASADETNGTVKVFSGFEVIDILKALPSSDAVQGEWTHDGSMWENRWVCNKCGHKIFERQTNFCPNCGAIMKGGDTE